jgi:dethiobiotin synthetase
MATYEHQRVSASGKTMAAVFITSTGTGIGKTFLTAGLVRYFRDHARSVEAYKPVISGFDPSAPEASDTGAILSALGRGVTEVEIDRISPWRFAAPLSPNMAASKEGREIDFQALVTYSRKCAASADIALIEGVGGIMVPLDNRHTVLDWMVEIRLPTLLVVGSYLGTISHTLSALEVLERRGLEVRAIVIDETVDSSVALDDTVATINQFAQQTDVIALPHLEGASQDHPAFAHIGQRL